MTTRVVRTLGRVVAGAPLLALLTAVTFHVWLGHGDVPRVHPDPVTGSVTGASAGWAFGGFLATLAVLVAATVWRWLPGWLPPLVVPAALLATVSASMSGEDPLWQVAAAFLTATVVIWTGVVALTTVVVRNSRREHLRRLSRPWQEG